jgi:hypothetical protein
MTIEHPSSKTIYYAADPSGMPITGEIDRSDPGNPSVRLEAGCNELWLSAGEARAVIAYLQEVLPDLERGGEDG